MEKLQKEKMYLRKVTEADKDLLYRWCNDSQCRANSLNSDAISYETHCRWFEEKLANKESYMYICIKEEQPIGQIRIDCINGTGNISYSIDLEHRGNGLGYEMLKLVEDEMWEKIERFHAVVKVENVASQRCFEKLGYNKKKEEKIYHYCKEKDY